MLCVGCVQCVPQCACLEVYINYPYVGKTTHKTHPTKHTPNKTHPHQQYTHPHQNTLQTVRAYSNAREIVKEAIANETKAFIQQNPSVCGALNASACQSFVRRTVVTQPDYQPITRPALPTLVDVLARQLVVQGVFKSEVWAQAAAQR